MSKHTTTGSIFDDLGFDEAESENLKIRAALMRSIEQYIKKNNLTQLQAAKAMGVTQPRISNLIKGHIDKFTIDMLVNMLARAHVSITLVVDNQMAA